MIGGPRTGSLGPARILNVLEVRPQADGNGRDLVVLDWVGDGTVPVPARHDRDMPVPPSPGDEVLVVLAGRTPVVVCRLTAGPPSP